MSKTTIKAEIDVNITQNGTGAITGNILNGVLNDMIDEMMTAGYKFAGIASLNTNPGTPSENIFYLALSKGEYPYFNLSLVDGEVSLFLFDGTGWSKSSIGLATMQTISGFVQDVEDENYSEALIDAAGKMLESRDNRGAKTIHTSLDVAQDFTAGNMIHSKAESDSYIHVLADENGRMVCAIKNDGTHCIFAGIESPTIDEIYAAIGSIEGGSAFIGKKISILGDSISTFCYTFAGKNPSMNPADVVNSEFMGCQNVHSNYCAEAGTSIQSPEDTWWGQLCEMSGAELNYVRAIGSASVVNILQNLGKELYSNRLTGDAPDIIILNVGTNDVNESHQMGTKDDYSDGITNTFYGAYVHLLDSIQQEYPNATIICLTPLYSAYYGTDKVPFEQVAENSGKTIRDYADAIIDIARLMNVTCIDMSCMVNINRFNYQQWMFDMTHPNKLGFSMMAKAILKNGNYLINK